VRPEDLSATIYHMLGVDQHAMLRTPDGRPVPVSAGNPLLSVVS